MQAVLTRRRLIVGGAVVVAAGAGAAYLLKGDDMDAYNAMTAALRAPLAPGADLRELVRYATLAANSHNTQPWRFRLGERRIDILPDLSRRTPVVDPDDHHLFATLGCAAENLVVAAAARGLHATPVFDPAGDGAISLAFEAGAPAETPAFAAIPARGVSRSTYDGKPLANEAIATLAAAAESAMVEAILITDRAKMEKVLSLIVEGSNAQYADQAYVAELKEWIRFNPGAAMKTGDGLLSAASGNPTAPTWLGRLLFSIFLSAKQEADKTAAEIRSSAGLVVLVSRQADKANWVEAGRSCQRFALAATALGLRHAFVNQAVEVPAVRDRLAGELGIPGRRPDLILRFGRGPEMPKSLRRPVQAVIEEG